MRALLVAVMATVGLVAALASALLWTVGRDLLDEERFTDDAIVALRAPEGRDALGARVVAAVGVPDDPAASFVSRAAIDALVRRVVFSPAFAAALAPELARAHREFLDLSGEPVTIDLGGVRELVAQELAGIDQSLAVPAEGAPSLPDIQLATGIEAPGIPGARIADRTPAIVGLLAVAAAALVAIAIALAERTRRATAWIGGLLVVAAVVPALARRLVPDVARSRVPAPDDALAWRLAVELMDGWWLATIALAAAGVLLVISATVPRPRRPRSPTPAA
jgi:hypothetical protein